MIDMDMETNGVDLTRRVDHAQHEAKPSGTVRSKAMISRIATAAVGMVAFVL